jgi:hypothetical protein
MSRCNLESIRDNRICFASFAPLRETSISRNGAKLAKSRPVKKDVANLQYISAPISENALVATRSGASCSRNRRLEAAATGLIAPANLSMPEITKL